MPAADSVPTFVTYGWCRTAYALVRSLGRRGVPVHVGDESGLAMSRVSRYARSFTRLPDFFTQPEPYFDAVVAALRRCGARVLLPGHEDVGVFAARRDRLPPDVQVALPDAGAYALAEDKLAVLARAAEAGCAVPPTRRVTPDVDLCSTADELGWPVVVKTRIGNSAKGVAIAHTPEEVRAKFDGFVHAFGLAPARWPFLQAYLPGEPVGVCAILDRGRCVALFGERYLRTKEGGRFGTSTLRCTFMPTGLLDAARRVLEGLGWHGIAHCDFISDADGTYRLIEINPRPWGAIWLAVEAGIDFPYLWYRLACGDSLPPEPPSAAVATCRWIVGDLLAAVTRLAQRNVGGALGIFRPLRRCAHDDFDWRDPLPLALEACDYLVKAVRARGTNPVRAGMIR